MIFALKFCKSSLAEDLDVLGIRGGEILHRLGSARRKGSPNRLPFGGKSSRKTLQNILLTSTWRALISADPDHQYEAGLLRNHSSPYQSLVLQAGPLDINNALGSHGHLEDQPHRLIQCDRRSTKWVWRMGCA